MRKMVSGVVASPEKKFKREGAKVIKGDCLQKKWKESAIKLQTLIFQSLVSLKFRTSKQSCVENTERKRQM